MGEFISTLLQNLLLIFVLFCVLPSILVLIAGFFAVRSITRSFTTDAGQLRNDYDKLAAKNPNAPPQVLVNRLLRRQAVKCGLVGAVTGMGGFLTFPIALPVDVVLSLRLQASMVNFIAHAYGVEDVGQTERRARTYLVMTGGLRATQSSFNFIMRILIRLMGKSFAKLIPFLGALVGYILNYAAARATAETALRWYADKARKQQTRAAQLTGDA